jgi:SAM-dependent methyltransferase
MQQNKMQEDWDRKGRENAYYWSSTETEDWDPDEFYASGKKDVDRFLTPLFEGKDTSKMTALDIGCATGRMTRHFRFGKVVGVDVSPSMIARGRIDNPKIEFHVMDGTTLRGLASNQFDFVFSYSSLNHLTRKKYLKGMFAEIYRVMKPGSTARINVRGFPGASIGVMAWWRSFDRFYIAIGRVRGIPVPYIRFFNTQTGVCVNEKQLVAMTRHFNKAVPLRIGPTQDLWIDLVK